MAIQTRPWTVPEAVANCEAAMLRGLEAARKHAPPGGDADDEHAALRAQVQAAWGAHLEPLWAAAPSREEWPRLLGEAVGEVLENLDLTRWSDAEFNALCRSIKAFLRTQAPRKGRA
jgi:hypothetical protein